MSEPTYDEGELTADDLIVSADGTGYETPSEFVQGVGGIEPDDPSYDTTDDSFDDSSEDDSLASFEDDSYDAEY